MASITVPVQSADTSPRQLNAKKRQPLPYVLLVPTLAILGFFVGIPVVQMFITSFQKFGREQVFGKPPTFTGWDNYLKVLNDPSFYQMLARSFGFMIAAVVATIVLGTLMALLMMRLNKFFRMLLTVGMLLAWATPALVTTTLWGWIFDTSYGLLNFIMTKLTGDNWMGHSWLMNPWSFFLVLGVIIVWGAIPFVTFTLYAGLTQIPGEVIEAAQMDGASPVQRFFQIQMPYVRGVYLVLIILSIIWDIRVYAQVVALQTIGGIAEQTSTFGVWIFQKGTASGDYGLSAAAAVIMVIVMMTISYYSVRQTLKEDN